MVALVVCRVSDLLYRVGFLTSAGGGSGLRLLFVVGRRRIRTKMVEERRDVGLRKFCLCPPVGR